MRNRWWAPAGLAAVVLIAVASGSAATASTASTASAGNSSSRVASGPGMRPPTFLKTAEIHGVAVLTNARGFTLYWFARDTAMGSNCDGRCAHAWPPVEGPATAGPGLSGRLGTIRRGDGSIQATYNGRPLYTFIGDLAPGQASGNGLYAFGGLWHEVTVYRMPYRGPAPRR
jgi:predicted lipoprotein with Yx(FWY)xxD motif